MLTNFLRSKLVGMDPEDVVTATQHNMSYSIQSNHFLQLLSNVLKMFKPAINIFLGHLIRIDPYWNKITGLYNYVKFSVVGLFWIASLFGTNLHRNLRSFAYRIVQDSISWCSTTNSNSHLEPSCFRKERYGKQK